MHHKKALQGDCRNQQKAHVGVPTAEQHNAAAQPGYEFARMASTSCSDLPTVTAPAPAAAAGSS